MRAREEQISRRGREERSRSARAEEGGNRRGEGIAGAVRIHGGRQITRRFDQAFRKGRGERKKERKSVSASKTSRRGEVWGGGRVRREPNPAPLHALRGEGKGRKAKAKRTIRTPSRSFLQRGVKHGVPPPLALPACSSHPRGPVSGPR